MVVSRISVVSLLTILMTSAICAAGPYNECMLKNASAIRDTAGDALDLIADSCIKTAEEDIGVEGAKIKINFSFGQMQMLREDMGLILDFYNGSDFDITSLTVSVVDKKSKVQRLHKQTVWLPYIPTAIVKVWPEFRYRFVKAQTSGKYIFPIGVVDGQSEFFQRYEVRAVSAKGVK